MSGDDLSALCDRLDSVLQHIRHSCNITPPRHRCCVPAAKPISTIMARKTLFDKLLARIKNNPVVASILVVGTIIIAVSTFTDAAQKLLGLIIREKTIDVTGKWRTEVLTNPYDETERYTLLFDFVQHGDTILGTVREIDVGESDGFAKNITEGKIKNNVVSFYTQGEVTSDNGTRPYKESYSGIIGKTKSEIAFERLDNLPEGGVPERWVAKRN